MQPRSSLEEVTNAVLALKDDDGPELLAPELMSLLLVPNKYTAQINYFNEEMEKLYDQDSKRITLGNEIIRVYGHPPLRPPGRKLDPVPSYLPQCNAIGYLCGALTILEHTEAADKEEKKNRCIDGYENLKRSLANEKDFEKKCLLLEAFHDDLCQLLNVKSKELTAAKDCASLLRKEVSVCTVTRSAPDAKGDREVVTQLTRPTHVGEGTRSYLEKKDGLEKKHDAKDAADRKMELDFEERVWFKNAIRVVDKKNRWLGKFYRKNADALIRRGVSAPPSARWMPHLANAKREEILVGTVDSKGKLTAHRESHSQRIGVLSPFLIESGVSNPQEVRVRCACNNLIHLINENLPDYVNRYVSLYQGLYENKAKVDFYINIETLLSPLIGEALARAGYEYTDSNHRFIEETKMVLGRLTERIHKEGSEKVFPSLKNIPDPNPNHLSIDLVLLHGNIPINNLRGLTTSDSRDTKCFDVYRKSVADELRRFEKKFDDKEADKAPLNAMIRCLDENASSQASLKAEDQVKFVTIISKLKLGQYDATILPTEAQSELALRCEGAFGLRGLNKEADNPGIVNSYLGRFALGSQSMSLRDCKSSSDRFSYNLLAHDAAFRDPPTIGMQPSKHDKQLKSSMRDLLAGGHYHHALNQYNRIIKMSEVGKEFKKLASKELQRRTKAMKRFAKPVKPRKWYDAVKNWPVIGRVCKMLDFFYVKIAPRKMQIISSRAGVAIRTSTTPVVRDDARAPSKSTTRALYSKVPTLASSPTLVSAARSSDDRAPPVVAVPTSAPVSNTLSSSSGMWREKSPPSSSRKHNHQQMKGTKEVTGVMRHPE